MSRVQQTMVNNNEHEMYISIEPTAECHELEKEETLTMIDEQRSSGDGLEITFMDRNELVIVPLVQHPEPSVLVSRGSAEGRIWSFRHG